jgi:phosphatidylserine decarboxylase
VQAAPDEVVSPADGQVMVAGEATGRFATGGWQQITIFLSPMDVHVNRMPLSGRVTSVKYHPGKFLPAYRPDAGDLNEHTEVTLDHAGTTIVVRQIVGILARRIVCRVREGDVVSTGARFGVMKFGSRMDVFLPKGGTIRVTVGDRVQAGVTIIATLQSTPSGGPRP